jgi:DNA-binding FadR family transcriptional regulator
MALLGANRKSLADQLYSEVKDRIRSGKFGPGQRLPTEDKFTKEFQVSRTVVREAMARLSADGLVKARHGAGVFVTETAHYEAFQITHDELGTYDDVARLLELRLAVETEMAGLAAERRTQADIDDLQEKLAAITADPDNPDSAVDADAALHLAIAGAAGNPYFERFLVFLGVRLVPNRSLVMRGHDERQRKALLTKIGSEHETIVAAIAAGDARAARAAARRHLTASIKRHANAAALATHLARQ